MGNTSDSRKQRCYVQVESSYGEIPNSGGTASVANGDACLITSLVTKPTTARIQRPDKTGTLSAVAGYNGRKIGEWSASMSMAGSGTAGTAPDCDPFLQALFGQAGTVVPATSVTYALADAHPSLSIYNYRSPSTMTQKVAFGAIVQSMRCSFGDDVPTMDFSGQARWVLDSLQMVDLLNGATGKGGLTGATFPSEPASPVTNGDMAIGFTGVITIDSNTYSSLRAGSIAMDMARELPQNIFNSYFPGGPAADLRSIGLDFRLDDEDDSDLNSLKLKAINGTHVDIIFQIGTVAGNIWTWNLNNCILGAPDDDDSERKWGVGWGSGQAFSTSITSLDEISLVLT